MDFTASKPISVMARLTVLTWVRVCQVPFGVRATTHLPATGRDSGLTAE
ncbi:hypothetical protein Q667_06855 [Marinobacter sp. C1S70]|nr:hypothetical protein [Marinobacter sp. C1S70]ERS82255.1 hypothetical protein Q667_06855 [Marinobacter sp. C1S70]